MSEKKCLSKGQYLFVIDIQTHILLLELTLSVDGLSSNYSVNCLQIVCQLTVLSHLIVSKK